MKRAIVLGAGGFIGNHLVARLKSEGVWVKGVDLVYPAYNQTEADEYLIGDLRDRLFVEEIIDEDCDELYQLAGDVGGAGYIFTGEHDADVMHNSAQINLNVVRVSVAKKVRAVFFSSSACMYPAYNQIDPENPMCEESSAYPADPDSEYGWEKLFSERLYLSYKRNYGLNVKIARFHNIYGSLSTWQGGKEKAPAALCRKVIQAKENEPIEVWGDGLQTRSFLYIDDCLDAVLKLMRSDFTGPYNIGSEEMISIQNYIRLIQTFENKNNPLRFIDGPQGVRGRCSHNVKIETDLSWRPIFSLESGTKKLYTWIQSQLNDCE